MRMTNWLVRLAFLCHWISRYESRARSVTADTSDRKLRTTTARSHGYMGLGIPCRVADSSSRGCRRCRGMARTLPPTKKAGRFE